MRDAEPGAASNSSELYAWLADREEQAHQRPDCTLPWTPEQPGYTGTAERLADLRAGRAVNIPAGSLPRWARDGVKYQWFDRAVVTPDGSVEFVNDTGEWLAENGL